MFSFDLSTINILLIAAVVALIILFITVLMKLNPSTEKKTLETEIKVETQQQIRGSPVSGRNPEPTKTEVPRITEKPPVVVNPTIEGSSIQAKQEISAPTRRENIESFKPEKNVASAKTVSNNSKRDCLHQFGYLRTLPKNAPIPDECFGCSKIVECLVKAKPDER